MSEWEKDIKALATKLMNETEKKPAEDRLKRPGDKPTLDDGIPDRTPRD